MHLSRMFNGRAPIRRGMMTMMLPVVGMMPYGSALPYHRMKAISRSGSHSASRTVGSFRLEILRHRRRAGQSPKMCCGASFSSVHSGHMASAATLRGPVSSGYQVGRGRGEAAGGGRAGRLSRHCLQTASFHQSLSDGCHLTQ